MQETLQTYHNLSLKAGSVADIVLKEPFNYQGNNAVLTDLRGEVAGIRTGRIKSIHWQEMEISLSHYIDEGEYIPCDKIIIATGTFLGGKINIGMEQTPYGRIE